MKTNVITQIKQLLGMEVKLEQMKLADGMTVIEAESFEPEMSVVIVTEDDQRIPLPVGEYELEDGRMLVVVVEGGRDGAQSVPRVGAGPDGGVAQIDHRIG